MEAETRSVQIQFPHYAAVLLESLNKHRLEGKFCDLSVHVQGRVFRAHKSVLAAASPYFHDKLLLRDTDCLVLPGVIEPQAFENLLQLIYSGRLRLLLEALPSHLLVASGLQMWQVVDQFSGILKELDGGPCRPWAAPRVPAESQSPSSSGGYFGPRGDDDRGEAGATGASHSRGGGAEGLGLPPEEEEEEEAEVVKIRVPHDDPEEEDEDEEEEDVACRGSPDGPLKVLEGEGGLSGRSRPPRGEQAGSSTSSSSSSGFASPHEAGAPRVFYIKQERFDPEEGPAGMGGPLGRALGVSEGPPGLCQAEIQESGQVSYIYPGASSWPSPPPPPIPPPGGFSGKGQVFSADSVAFPESSWKPLDLHGNEILAQAAHGQAVHAPVKLLSAPDGKKFGCLCGKRFAVKPKRDRHILLTFSLRPFGCSVCNKKFKLKHHLTEHMKTHEGTLYACEDCGRKFRVQSCFLKHKELCKGQGWATACWTYK
ncbi:zinc finger and BTB domain-containing protein 9 [Sceloporus undulatus]|uniref:zinc finger and BTB domain-containing protein 9 n=1 Tax=Sceloporus undulatus TaxID=8520 RepID=UPI001C4D0949|nr:zinc finger and BTB domain-containing protein 9 [Sceloporus undulatus]